MERNWIPPFSGGTGFSSTAKSVGQYYTEGRKSQMETVTYGYPFIQLNNVFDECSSEGWDGYNAMKIQQATYQNAFRFLQNLPSSLPSPEISAEPDGHIVIEWYRDKRHVVSISISQESYLHFAALIGLKKRYGSEPFFNEIPSEIIAIIQKIIEV